MEILIFLAGLALGLLLMRQRATPASSAAAPEQAADTADTPTPPTPEQAATAQEAPRDRLLRLKREIENQDERIQQPQDLLALAEFNAGAQLLSSEAFTAAEVVEHLGSGGYVLPSMAAIALPRRADSDPAAALAATNPFGGYPLRFMLDYLQTLDDAATLPQQLRHARGWWWEAQGARQRLREYFRWAQGRPSAVAAADLDEFDERVLEEQKQALSAFKEPLLAPYLAQLDEALSKRRERRVLNGFGRVMTQAGSKLCFMHTELAQQLVQLHEKLAGAQPRSVLITGEHGVGKSVLIERLATQLLEEGWLVFEATAAEILAGQKYIGELEGRVREMLGVLNRRRALWRVPDFFDLLHKGSHTQDPRGILDLVMPAIERGELLLIGEVTPRQLVQLLSARPVLRHHFEIFSMQAAEGALLQDISKRWAQHCSEHLGVAVADERALAEARRLAAQYFPEQHEPGRTLRLLEEALKNAGMQEPPALPLTNDTLLAAIAARSGMPLDVIDDRQSLDLEVLHAFFRQRVLGQDEAVDCLVDRIAMLKAGLIDSARPVGVFLFAGPTGTGKTEMAKALGELLFGSADRLLRLDMSEYQSEDSAWRLLGDGDTHAATRSLTARIREQPFSVVLLDEFEKAHPKVWDLFLQVFDDGRLSDRSGNLADFRHSIIILTSNVGSTLSRSAGPGFTAAAGAYSRGAVEKALFETFRREFLNRLDRIVLFGPLDRALMREILHKELNRVLTRRGLRSRDWAVEWEPSAIEFLLDRGFTPDLGARPLRRAIEHHLLAPLARRIVEHRAPDGDQFLFVSSNGEQLDVQFIDPNANAAQAPAPVTDAATDLRDLIYAPTTAPAAIARLRSRQQQLAEIVASADWTTEREADFSLMADSGFWADAGRFEVLDRIERRDRIESALDAVERMSQRMHENSGDVKFAERLAQLLFLLGLATESLRDGRAQDALLEISASESEPKRQGAEVRLWWQRLLGMYLAWAQRRNMRVEVLRQDAQECHAWLAVSGFGALDLLAPERGLHVLEQDGTDAASTPRIPLQVRVSSDLPGRRRRLPDRADADQRICRRYREGPSPLVRDATRGWRSGRLDRVLDGDFDVMPTQ